MTAPRGYPSSGRPASDLRPPPAGPAPGERVADAAISAGMTEREADTWQMVSRAAGSYLRLTEDEPHHGMEREEVCHAFHVIQGWLAGRPFVRAMGTEENR